MYREIRPAPALRRHVACYWEACARGAAQRVLPDGCMDILLRVEGGVTPYVVGAMTRAVISPDDGAAMIGVRFRPGEAFAFLDVASSDARDALLSPLDAGRPELGSLADAVASAPPAGRIRALEDALLARLPRARPADARVRRAVDLLLSSRGTVRVAQLALAVGLGDRQLERAFDERVGLGPKALARVLRLQALVASLDAHGPGAVPWARLAAEAGYADQAHLVRDVRALAGLTPGELRRERMSDFFKAAASPGGISGAERTSP
ncbi:MAG TPA: helix-turn-helix domain-containing protein [Polyangiaceae bacterium]